MTVTHLCWMTWIIVEILPLLAPWYLIWHRLVVRGCLFLQTGLESFFADHHPLFRRPGFTELLLLLFCVAKAVIKASLKKIELSFAAAGLRGPISVKSKQRALDDIANGVHKLIMCAYIQRLLALCTVQQWWVMRGNCGSCAHTHFTHTAQQGLWRELRSHAL
jgi:hypothetical protein